MKTKTVRACKSKGKSPGFNANNLLSALKSLLGEEPYWRGSHPHFVFNLLNNGFVHECSSNVQLIKEIYESYEFLSEKGINCYFFGSYSDGGVLVKKSFQKKIKKTKRKKIQRKNYRPEVEKRSYLILYALLKKAKLENCFSLRASEIFELIDQEAFRGSGLKTTISALISLGHALNLLRKRKYFDLFGISVSWRNHELFRTSVYTFERNKGVEESKDRIKYCYNFDTISLKTFDDFMDDFNLLREGKPIKKKREISTKASEAVNETMAAIDEIMAEKDSCLQNHVCSDSSDMERKKKIQELFSRDIKKGDVFELLCFLDDVFGLSNDNYSRMNVRCYKKVLFEINHIDVKRRHLHFNTRGGIYLVGRCLTPSTEFIGAYELRTKLEEMSGEKWNVVFFDEMNKVWLEERFLDHGKGIEPVRYLAAYEE